MVEMAEYIGSNPQFITKGFRKAGITGALNDQDSSSEDEENNSDSEESSSEIESEENICESESEENSVDNEEKCRSDTKTHCLLLSVV